MKNLQLIFLFCSFVLLNSCHKDSDDDAINPELTGVWNLVKVSGGLLGNESEFARQLISWRFSESARTVTVTNNNTNPDLDDILESGTYNYVTTDNGGILFCKKSIAINNSNYGCLTFVEGNLRIDNSPLDGARIDFIR